MNKFLTVINIDETQNPVKWLSKESAFDLVFLSYSNNLDFYRSLKDLTIGYKNTKCFDYGKINTGKWNNLYHYLVHRKIEYEYYWFPDPDLEISIRDINEFCNFARQQNFGLCQPSLTKDSLCSHHFLKSQHNSNYRSVPFVEVMCPLFRNDILLELLWTFNGLSYSGYGLDFLWAKEMKERGLSVQVIDKFQIKHPRAPQFQNEAAKRGWPDPGEELKWIRREFGC